VLAESIGLAPPGHAATRGILSPEMTAFSVPTEHLRGKVGGREKRPRGPAPVDLRHGIRRYGRVSEWNPLLIGQPAVG